MDVVGEIFSGFFRALFRILVEVIFEVLIKGVGYVICRGFSKKVNPDSVVTAIVGLLVWGLIIVGSIQLIESITVDSCLDSGGRFNYEAHSCEYE